MNRPITIIDNINGEIRRHGMSKEAFCNLLGVDRSTYKGWQSRGEIPGTKLLKCARIFGCSMDYLVIDVTLDVVISTLIPEKYNHVKSNNPKHFAEILHCTTDDILKGKAEEL